MSDNSSHHIFSVALAMYNIRVLLSPLLSVSVLITTIKGHPHVNFQIERHPHCVSHTHYSDSIAKGWMSGYRSYIMVIRFLSYSHTKWEKIYNFGATGSWSSIRTRVVIPTIPGRRTHIRAGKFPYVFL